MLLTKEQILAQVDSRAYKTAPVVMEEWGGEVLVREFDLAEREVYESFCAQNKETGKRGAGIRARLIQMTVVGQDGSQYFSEADLPKLELLPYSTAKKIFDKALELNGLGDKAKAAAEKNSETTPAGDSSSA
jgi:hypothetical protein